MYNYFLKFCVTSSSSQKNFLKQSTNPPQFKNNMYFSFHLLKWNHKAKILTYRFSFFALLFHCMRFFYSCRHQLLKNQKGCKTHESNKRLHVFFEKHNSNRLLTSVKQTILKQTNKPTNPLYWLIDSCFGHMQETQNTDLPMCSAH